MSADCQTLWDRDFVLILRVWTIATFPNSILNDQIGQNRLEPGVSR